MNQNSASSLNVLFNVLNQNYTCEIDNISWDGSNFNGQIDAALAFTYDLDNKLVFYQDKEIGKIINFPYFQNFCTYSST